MRPRHLCLGCTRIWCVFAPWRRRFNEAEASLPRMPRRLQDGRRSKILASMRPRHLCLGCRPNDMAPRVEYVEASMRPRHLCLGCGRLYEAIQRVHRASMRPRHLCLGCRHPQKGRRSKFRCFNEAEASLPRMQRSSLLPLLQSVRFNEAEASLPRMPAASGEKKDKGYPALQ